MPENPFEILNFLAPLFTIPPSEMTQHGDKAPKHCAQKGLNLRPIHGISRKLLFLCSSLIVSILTLTLLIWLILRPSKPEFSLQQAQINQLSLSGNRRLLNTSLQITLLSRNPNRKVGIFYGSLRAHAAYRGQQITGQASLPPFYQGHRDANLLSASLGAAAIPVAPSLWYDLGRDRTAGKLGLALKVSGKIRWKVGAWVTTVYRLNVNCSAVMAFGPTIPSAPVSTEQGGHCSTDL